MEGMCPLEAWTFDMMECCLWKLCLNKLFTDLHGSRDEQHRAQSYKRNVKSLHWLPLASLITLYYQDQNDYRPT
eukprot:2515880-Amphidinium_carterae.1